MFILNVKLEWKFMVEEFKFFFFFEDYDFENFIVDFNYCSGNYFFFFLVLVLFF